MKLGRPKEFERTDALQKAMKVFWANGYEGASVCDLLEGMGINRGSMYDTFGDKRSLFLEALGHYQNTVIEPLTQMICAPGSPLGNVRKTLCKVADAAGGSECHGCLLTNTTVETAPHDAEVAKVMRASLRAIEDAFFDALERAIKNGELNRKAETRALARFLTNALQGLVVTCKAKLGKQTREDIIRVTMAALRQ
ncbi:MAG: TetR/AcrR family transcriptional regulator [Phycisphaerales bacterium]|nr:TetR/AcrR family transcriptional regulator [Phycisphaerales bacterium]